MGKGGIIGKANEPTSTVASGMWSLREHFAAEKAITWPKFFPDTYFNYVTMLLQGDGTNGAQNNTFIDSSTNNFTITRNGNTTQGSFGPYGDRWSNYFDGTGDYLSFTGITLNGDFCLEAWYYRTGSPANGYSVIFGGSSAFTDNNNNQFTVQNNGAVSIALAGSVVVTPAGTAAGVNGWNHIAYVRSGSSLAIFVNGVRQATGTSSINTSICSRIGDIAGFSGYSPIGYISNARIVVGSSVYDPALTTLTVPAGPLTAITNTSLLTCQSNRFIDNSTSNLAITRNGDVAVYPFNPFLPSAAYSTSVNGGSGYWAGTTELAGLTLGNSLLGSSDFCIEFWAYIPDLSTSGGTATVMPLVSNFDWYNGATSASIFIAYDSGQFGFYLYTGAGTNVSSAPNSSVLTGASSAVLGMWHHIACTRSGATIKIYQNGVEKSSATLSSNTAVNFDARDIYVGRNYLNNAGSPTTSRYFKGYISDFRMVVGSTVYTGNFTPPTTPLTSISNTSRLLNFTNAGIVDSAADNVFETVGNAQISTSVKKYGTGSLAFDGSGDYLVSSSLPDLYAFGSGNFTIEFWLYLNATQTSIFYDSRPISGTGATPTIYVTSNVLYYFVNNANQIIGPTLANTTWYHIAVCKSGTSTRMFVNGTQVGSTYTDSVTYINSAGRPIIGASGQTLAANPLNGYIDDLRVTKGFARYTANFTAPTQALPNR